MLASFERISGFGAAGVSARLFLMAVSVGVAPARSEPVTPQLELARPLAKEARAIVVIKSSSVLPVDPSQSPMRLQDFEVRGIVAACLKGPLKSSQAVAYRLTSEGRPDGLAHDHIAFLRKAAQGRWVAVDGPVFHDTPALRRGVLRVTGGCR